MRDPILSKPDVRRAIHHAIDRERIIRDIQRGYAEQTDTMFAKGHWARAENLPAYPFDPNKARQLLAQAGFPKGFSFTFKTSTDAEANSRAQVIQQMLKEVGINMQIQSNEMSTFFADIGNIAEFEKSSDFKIVNTSGSVYQYVSINMRDPILSKPDVRRAIHHAIDRERIIRDIQRGYAEIQKIVQEDLPYISLYMQKNVAVMRSNIDGYVQYPAGFWLSVPQMSIR